MHDEEQQQGVKNAIARRALVSAVDEGVWSVQPQL